MRLFLDANILVSVLNHEMPVFSYSSRVLSLPSFRSNYQLFTSPICLAIAYYFAEKKCGNKRAIEKMQILSGHLGITNIGQKEVIAVNTNIKVKDYEDGLQYYAALHAGCEAIITENINDFYFSDLPVYTSKEFILNIL
ncbi:MAG: twitching motility protein PilT [Cytophagaceae bacterium]|nr:twitching motility protein PilT [Cytophagaceae bacterium]MBL0300385.1 twitching motility protein PilT [Cytophagaceae bacterium]